MTEEKKKGWSALAAAIGFDLAYVGTEILVEGGLWHWVSPGVSALICLVGFYVLCLSLDYSMNFDVGEGQRDIPEQLGIRLHPVLEFILGIPYFILFIVCFIMVSFGFPTWCIHEMLIQWLHPKGIDALGPTSFGVFFLVGLMFFTLFFNFGMGSHFKGRKPLDGAATFFAKRLPVICIVVGASVSHLGGVQIERLVAERGVEYAADWAPTAYIVLYFPMRYIISRTIGITWISLGVAVLTMVTLGFIGG